MDGHNIFFLIFCIFHIFKNQETVVLRQLYLLESLFRCRSLLVS